MTYQSFGNYPIAHADEIWPIYWRDQWIDFNQTDKSFLCYAQGRSYGDSCLNAQGILLDTQYLNRFIEFDIDNGTLICEAGITFADILKYIVPKGWFLPVVPGTQFISLGGAIANDIHGKNHHHVGTFGRFVKRFELRRSDNSRVMCSPYQNIELYQATIGGLGLTGVITWAEIELIPIESAYLKVEKIRFNTLDEYVALENAAKKDHQYTVSWLDTTVLGRGIFMRANHASKEGISHFSRSKHVSGNYSVPKHFPGFLLNHLTIKAFNSLYYHASSTQTDTIHYQTFFFQLDALHHWNRLYGKKGFLQYQCTLPMHDLSVMKSLLSTVVQSREGSFLSVLKTFGALPSPGLLSFPKPGFTLALDFPFKGTKTLSLLNALDAIVSAHQGRVYPAKDARMARDMFKQYYPNWHHFMTFKDQRFSSNFWHRVSE